jgi:hypothetical protein
MSNEEIVKVLQQMSAFACSIEKREALKAAIARLSALARTEWVIEWDIRGRGLWGFTDTFRTEDRAKEMLACYRRGGTRGKFRVVERHITETVKEW